MDVRALLHQARETTLWSQRELAERAGTSKSRLASYESGRVSPTVATLDRILAACGLQIRPQLEPLLARVDERVDRMLSGEVHVDTAELSEWVEAMESGPPVMLPGQKPVELGPVSWAFDGDTPLQLQGLAAEDKVPSIVIVLNENGRKVLRGLLMFHPRPWLDGSLEELAVINYEVLQSFVGLVRFQLVAQLPPVLSLHVDGLEGPVPVVTVDAVAERWPAHRETLNRLRERRGF